MTNYLGVSPLRPTKYLGPNVYTSSIVTRNRAPTGADVIQPETGSKYPLGCFWLIGKNPTTGFFGEMFYLSTIVANVATWENIGTSTTQIAQLTGNSGVAIPVAENVFVIGAGSLSSQGGSDTLTFSLIGLTNHAVLVGAGTSTITKVGPTATAGQVFQSGGSAADPLFSTATYPSTATGTGTILRADGTNWVATTATYPATTVINQLLYSSANNVVSGLTAGNNGVLLSTATGIPLWLPNSVTPGFVLTANSGAPPSWQDGSLQLFAYTNVTAAMSPYTVLASDYYISVDCSLGAVILNFPNVPVARQTWIVKDRTGNAATNNITLTTPGATVTFDGLTSYIMNSNYQSTSVLANATPTYEVFS